MEEAKQDSGARGQKKILYQLVRSIQLPSTVPLGQREFTTHKFSTLDHLPLSDGRLDTREPVSRKGRVPESKGDSS